MKNGMKNRRRLVIMAKNSGKQFESDIVSSTPPNVLIHRLNDTAQAYNNNKTTSFTWNNKCDFYMYLKPMFLAIECKSTKYKSMSVQLIPEDSDSSMIKYHQIKSLVDLSKYDGAISGFLFNFRHFEGEENSFETTYFQRIEDFLNMMSKMDKRSFNELDLLSVGNVIKVRGQLKRVRYRWDIESLLEEIINKYICE